MPSRDGHVPGRPVFVGRAVWADGVPVVALARVKHGGVPGSRGAESPFLFCPASAEL